LESGDETAGVEAKEGTWFMVWIYFDVLEGDVFFEKDKEDALDEGAELRGLVGNDMRLGEEGYPAGIEFQGFFVLVSLHHLLCFSSSMGEKVGIGVILGHADFLVLSRCVYDYGSKGYEIRKETIYFLTGL